MKTTKLSPLHFKSKEAYQKYLAYEHIHGLSKGRKRPVFVHEKKVKVNHGGY